MKAILSITLLIISCFTANALPKNQAFIKGSVPNLLPGDSIILVVWDELISERKAMNLPHRSYSCKPVNGQFTFTVPASATPAYFSLLIQNPQRKTPLARPIPLVDWYLLHAGDSSFFRFDSITIEKKVQTKNINFIEYFPAKLKEVAGSHGILHTCKMAIKQTIDSFYRQLKRSPLPEGMIPEDPKRVAMYYQTELAPSLQLQLATVKRFQKDLLPADFDRLNVDLIAEAWILQYQHFRGSIKSVRRNQLMEAIRKEHDQLFRNYFIQSMQRPNIPNVAFSKAYYALCYEELKTRHWVEKSSQSFDDFIYQMAEAGIRDKLITFYLVERFEDAENPETLLTKVLSSTKDGYCKKILSQLSAKMKGVYIRDFEFKDANNKTVKLSDFRNKIVMLDFWYTGCSNCAKLYKDVIALAEKKFLDNKEVIFVSISIDADRQAWLNSVGSGLYTSADKPNVVNIFTNGKGMDHPIIREFNMTGFPYCLLIGKDGKIDSNLVEELKDINNLISRIESLLK